MLQLWQKIKSTWTGSLLFGALLLFIFLILFYLSNLDLKKTPALEKAGEIVSTQNAEMKKRLGSSEATFLDFNSWAMQNKLGEGTEKYDSDADNDGLANYLEYIHGTDPHLADTDGDKFTDKQEIANGYDPAAPGDARPEVEIAIEKIGVRVPMIWSVSSTEKEMLGDLENGTAHFAKTASVGQIGNAVISGHSSNYFWAKGNYNHIFKDLNDLEIGDKISVKVIQKNGRVITYHYQITDKFITGPDDEDIFKNTDTPTLTLSTCWPLGTTFRRLIVKAEMVK